MNAAQDFHTEETRVWALLEQVPDPEIPVLSIVDLGIVRRVVVDTGGITVELAPTYNGCPAVEFIETSVVQELGRHTQAKVTTKRVLSPPWTTDWISASGRAKLKDYGIAPPPASSSKRSLLGQPLTIACPRCESTHTTRVSEFGSTPCKASYKCADCLEPFEYFKCI